MISDVIDRFEEDKVVFLSHLFHTKSDYVNLLRKSNKKSSND